MSFHKLCIILGSLVAGVSITLDRGEEEDDHS